MGDSPLSIINGTRIFSTTYRITSLCTILRPWVVWRKSHATWNSFRPSADLCRLYLGFFRLGISHSHSYIPWRQTPHGKNGCKRSPFEFNSDVVVIHYSHFWNSLSSLFWLLHLDGHTGTSFSNVAYQRHRSSFPGGLRRCSRFEK